MERRAVLRGTTPLCGDFRVYAVNRKPGLHPGASMSEIAGHLVTAIEEEFGEPVCLMGTSTGGSVALHLAVDRPDLVRALVVVASACRLGPRGRELQHELARLTRAGDAADGCAQLMTAMLQPPLQRSTRSLARRMMRSMAPDDPTDMLTTLDAEDACDVRESLHRISAPTLVIGGGKDVFYTPELFEQTAASVQDGRAHIHPDWGHLRTSASSATSSISLGFLLAVLRSPSDLPP